MSSHDEPLSPAELAEASRDGEPNWFEKRREAYPDSAAPQQDETCVSLDLALLDEEGPAEPLDAFVPPEAALRLASPPVIGGPFPPCERRAGAGAPPPPLRRFSGGEVSPAACPPQHLTTWLMGGVDNRTVFRDTAAPWVWVGQIRNVGTGRASACLVGKNIILTAAHAITPYYTPGQPMKPGIAFWPAMHDESSALGPTWSANVINAAAWKVNSVVGYDMAICKLDRPLGQLLGHFGSCVYDDDWEDQARFTHVGYPFDLGNWTRPCFQMGISVGDDDSDEFDTLEIETNADIASGQSGGPLWGSFEGGLLRVIGTLSGNQDHFGEPRNSCFAGGNGLVRLIRWGQENW